MSPIPFDVNDHALREQFFNHLLTERMDDLPADRLPLWGKMTPQHMVEHLDWAFECSTGVLELPCKTPENLLERTRKFLYDNRPTPREFKNPLLGDNPPPFRFNNFTEAKSALYKEIVSFVDLFHSQPDTIRVHPIFGPLDAEQWHRAQFKHCYHHMLQFGLIVQTGTISP